MNTYKVNWYNAIDAETPVEAARKARAQMLDANNLCTVFEVQHGAKFQTVNLLEHPEKFIVVGYYASAPCTRVIDALDADDAAHVFRHDVTRQDGPNAEPDRVEIHRIFKVGAAEELEL